MAMGSWSAREFQTQQGPESTLQSLVVALLGSGSLQPSTTVMELALRASVLPQTHSQLLGDLVNLPCDLWAAGLTLLEEQ